MPWQEKRALSLKIGGSGAGGVSPEGGRLAVVNAGRLGTTQPCDLDGGCPSGKVCFQLIEELGLCDDPQPEEATECSLDLFDTEPVDECGCEDRSCGEQEFCIVSEATCSCAGGLYNRCVERPCEASTDCPAGSFCVPPSYLPGTGTRCVAQTGCGSDADCDGGRCAVVVIGPSQAGRPTLEGTSCVPSTSQSRIQFR